MEFKLKLMDNSSINYDVYNMYQDIPTTEIGSSNKIKDCTFEDFKKIINLYINEQYEINPNLNTTTNRYIFYADNKPIGELGIRTNKDFYLTKESQIFYKIRLSDRGKGYGNKLLELGLTECKKLGIEKVRINCDDNNIKSKSIILKNGGKLDIKSYKTKDGYSSSYIIDLN